MNRIRTAVIAIVFVALMALASGCSTVSTQPDEVALHYKGGAISSQKFANCVDASDRNFDGPGDGHYVYPKGQRTFSFTGAEGSERGPMPVTTGSQEVLIPGFVTFTLNTDCETLRKFHEKIGNKYKAYKDGGGWDDFLNDYIAVPLSSTLNEAATSIETPEGGDKNQNWYLLYTDAQTQRAFEAFVKDNLPAEIEQTLGEDFITVNAVSISKPAVDDALKKSLAGVEQARLDNEAQKQKNETALTQYKTIGECLKTGLGQQQCTLIFLAQTGADIPFLPLPEGGDINYESGAPPAE